MNLEQFQDMDAMEQTHFWFRARREIIEGVLLSHDLTGSSLNVLEIGCGTGGNLVYFKKYYSQLKGCEISLDAIAFAKSKLTKMTIAEGSLPYNIPFLGEQFDLILIFDVLEHVECDENALVEIYKRLTNKGRLVVTVPAYQFLYGAYDKFLYHFRRYNRTNLNQILSRCGFKVEYASYFNCWLFPLVLISRLTEKLLNKTAKYAVSYHKGSLLNKVFYQIMRSERLVLKRKISLPFGSSIITVAKKNQSIVNHYW